MKYWVTNKTLKIGKSQRVQFQNWKYHGFRYLWWIKSIRVEDTENEPDNNLVTINFKYGLKVVYSMSKINTENLLADCGVKWQETF